MYAGICAGEYLANCAAAKIHGAMRKGYAGSWVRRCLVRTNSRYFANDPHFLIEVQSTKPDIISKVALSHKAKKFCGYCRFWWCPHKLPLSANKARNGLFSSGFCPIPHRLHFNPIISPRRQPVIKSRCVIVFHLIGSYSRQSRIFCTSSGWKVSASFRSSFGGVALCAALNKTSISLSAWDNIEEINR